MEVELGRIELCERGKAAVLAAASVVGGPLERALRVLVERNVVSVDTSATAVVVEPRQYVGELRYGHALIRITPKSPALFSGMLELARAGRRKELAGTRALALEGGEDVVNPRQALALLAEEVVAAGLPIVYRRVERNTSSPRGRILFNKTVRRFASKGVQHRVVCAAPQKRLDSRLCSVIATAGALAAPTLRDSLRDRLDVALEVVADDASLLPVAEALRVAAEVQQDFSNRPDVVLLAQVVQAVLREDPEEWCLTGLSEGANYRFLDVDRVWECACYAVLQQYADERENMWVGFHPLQRSDTRVFREGGPEIDPDMILYVDSAVSVVVDAKNKIEKTALADDVYQMLAYTERLSARAGLIVYLSDNAPWFKVLGRSSDGGLIAATGVGTTTANDLRASIAEMQLLATRRQRPS